MIKEILTTVPLQDLSWSGNEKKTANVYSDFVFYPDNLPEFSEQYPTPNDFTIVYRDELNVMQELACNYVSNGATRYTFSYKLDNDVINLSVFKSDGHLEINVRNAKLDYPMNLNQVEFQVKYDDGTIAYDIEIGSFDTLAGNPTVTPNTYVEGLTSFTIDPNPNPGYEFDFIEIYNVDETEMYYEGSELTHTAIWSGQSTEVYDDYGYYIIVYYTNAIEEYPITISSTTNCTASVSPNTYIKDETTFTVTVTPDAGYELDYILIQNLDGTSDYYQGTELTHLAEWDGAPDPLMPENPWGYRISAVCKEIPAVEYSITISEIEHGVVVADKETAPAGETVTLTITPEEGYELSTLTVVDGSGNPITVENNEFTMPEDNVNVSAVFTKVITIYTVTIDEVEHGSVTANPEEGEEGTLITLTITPDEGYEIDEIEVKDGDGNVISTSTTFNLPTSNVTVLVTFKEIPEPPVPTEGDLIFTTTFNRYAIVDVLVKEDGSAGVVNVRRLTEDDVDLDDTYETVLRAACTFRQDLIVGVEVEMNKPDNVAANYTVKSTKIFINGEEI